MTDTRDRCSKPDKMLRFRLLIFKEGKISKTIFLYCFILYEFYHEYRLVSFIGVQVIATPK